MARYLLHAGGGKLGGCKRTEAQGFIAALENLLEMTGASAAVCPMVKQTKPSQSEEEMRQEIRIRLKLARRAAKLTQGDAAAEMGVTRQTVSSWERGETAPSVDALASLCAVYGVSSDQILFGNATVEFGASALLAIARKRAEVAGDAAQ